MLVVIVIFFEKFEKLFFGGAFMCSTSPASSAASWDTIATMEPR